MGFFDRFQKKAGPETETRDRFRYRIDDVFKIKSKGAVVTGQVLLGGVRRGETVSYGPAPGEAAFPCRIAEIEQPDPATRKSCHPEEARADGPFRGSYAFFVPEHAAEEFQSGHYLFKE